MFGPTRSRTIVAALSIATVLLAASCQDGAGVASRERPIIGGVPVGGAYPAVGLLADLRGDKPVFVCSGVLIAPDAVLTAAHCLEAFSEADVGFALASELSGLAKGAFRSPSRIDIEPLYAGIQNAPLGLGKANDIALMSFAQDFSAAPILILRPSEAKQALVTGTRVTVVGAGQNVAPPDTDGVGTLRQASIRLADIGQFELDLALQGDPQPCFGDSGGPVLWSASDGSLRLLGVISRNANAAVSTCQDGALATRADEYVPFIASNITLPCGSGLDPQEGCPDAGAGGGGDASPTADGGSGTGTGTGTGGGGVIVPKPDSGCAIAGHDVALGCASWLLVLLGLAAARRRRRPEER
jgi:secreted trypsin-like serine protease